MPDNAHVYIVDDDEAVRDSLSVLLESCAYQVRAFGLAQEFLDAAPALPPGCLIADIRMPEMDGLELQRCLSERSLSFPLIVITGHGDVPLAVRAMKRGAVDFLEKPYNNQQFLECVQHALHRDAVDRGQQARAATFEAALRLLTPR